MNQAAIDELQSTVGSRTAVLRIVRMMDYYAANPLASLDDAAEFLGVSRRTITDYRRIARGAIEASKGKV